ncbi:ComEC/Rec2 family competence protein [Streptomyces griseoluteus]|uniref:ComEC/Rec2 family competence protein n=1 Tax=Streptomyces griseoluteus TaxID=29306 RepID=UPI0033255948
MADLLLTAPESNQIEVSLFGPGYGECIVIHAGDGDWIINDSCSPTGRRGRNPVALDYLQKLGVDVSKQVKLVVASHWDDDHVRGLAGLVEACTSARFICSAALGQRSFLELVAAAEADASTSLGSGVSEFKKIIDLKNQGKVSSFDFAVNDKLVWRNSKTTVQVHSLAPSSESVLASHHEIAGLVEQVRELRIRVPRHNPNSTSVVLWIDFGDFRVLLGGDLENHSNPQRGWKAIISSETRPVGVADIYKVAHHGSPNAHLDDIWAELLGEGNYSIISPWSLGRGRLPDPVTLGRISTLSGHTYVTVKPGQDKPIERSRLVMEEMRKATISWKSMDPRVGHIQMRRTHGSPDWRVGLSGNASTGH